MVIKLRVRRGSPGLVHISPQAQRVMKSWNGALNSLSFAFARSTWASPSTSRRTFIPALYRFRSSIYTPPSRLEESQHHLVEFFFGFEIRKVCRVQFDVFGQRDVLGEIFGVCQGNGGIVFPGNDERGNFHLAEGRAFVRVADRRAARGVALRIGVLEHFEYRGRFGGMRDAIAGRQPTLEHPSSHGFHATVLDRRDARVPCVSSADLRGGVRENNFV